MKYILRSIPASDYLKSDKQEPPQFEEVPPDFDDGWTKEEVIATAKKILKKLGMEDKW